MDKQKIKETKTSLEDIRIALVKKADRTVVDNRALDNIREVIVYLNNLLETEGVL